MTETEVRNLYVNTAKTYLGAVEGGAQHKEIVSLYNSIKPLPVGYALKTTDDWCAAFVSAMAQKCKLTDIIFPECGCNRIITLYKKAGRWVEDDAYVPKVGDILFYDWQDDGKGDNTGSPDHVCIVEKVEGGKIHTIEGNYGNSVARRTLAVNGKYIRGFGIPDYASKGKNIKAEQTVKPEAKKHIIEVDGIWGADTTRKIQKVFGCTVDGICGKQTITALQKWCGATQDGIRGKQTNKAMQRKLNALGASPRLAVDGDFGKKSVTALQTWLNEQ